MQKYVPLVKQNVMKFEVFILGGQIIDQKRWWRGRRERIEKGGRKRLEKRERDKKFEEKEGLRDPSLF